MNTLPAVCEQPNISFLALSILCLLQWREGQPNHREDNLLHGRVVCQSEDAAEEEEEKKETGVFKFVLKSCYTTRT